MTKRYKECLDSVQNDRGWLAFFFGKNPINYDGVDGMVESGEVGKDQNVYATRGGSRIVAHEKQIQGRAHVLNHGTAGAISDTINSQNEEWAGGNMPYKNRGLVHRVLFGDRDWEGDEIE